MRNLFSPPFFFSFFKLSPSELQIFDILQTIINNYTYNTLFNYMYRIIHSLFLSRLDPSILR